MKTIAVFILAMVFSISLRAQMSITVNTTLTGFNILELPLTGAVDAYVNWGDGSGTQHYITGTQPVHVYNFPGNFIITITGTVTHFGKSGGYTNADCITAVSSFGSLGTTDFSYAFYQATHLQTVPASLPAGVTNTSNMFYNATQFNSNISNWNVSSVTNMSRMFYKASVFNQDLSSWDVSNVTDMSYMFYQAGDFNQNLNTWNVSNVTNMAYMFHMYDPTESMETPVFNGNISSWNVGNVTDMSYMFAYAFVFNQDISNWNVSSVTNMASMFKRAYVFNSNLSNWNVSNVTDMSYMFYQAYDFNQDISAWNVGAVTDMSYMFNYVSTFNADLSAWNVSNVTNMTHMFHYANAFNQDISIWNVGSVTNMSSMFFGASTFNSNIGSWNVGSVTDMTLMFNGATAFNQDIGSWNVSNVVNMRQMFGYASAFNQDLSNWDVSNVPDMSWMFGYASAFNQDISSWDVSSVTNMFAMFDHAVTFNQNIGNWNVSNVTNMGQMFIGVPLSVVNYDALLNGWSALTLQSGVNFQAGGCMYSCHAEAARAILIGPPNNWTISDGGSTGGSTASTLTETACESYTSPSGNYTWYTSGTYLDEIPNSIGCDSVITINLTITDIDNSVIQNNDTLTASATGMTYQWLDCNNGNAPVSGATGQTYIAPSYGSYAVVISDGSCSDTSDCIIYQNDTIVFINPNNYSIANQQASIAINNCSIIYDQVDSVNIYNYFYVDPTTTGLTIRVYYNSTYTDIVENINTPIIDVYQVEMIIYCSSKSGNHIVFKVIDYINTGVFTNVVYSSTEDITIYPNPTKGQITINVQNIKKVEICNYNGEFIQASNRNVLDLSSFEKGFYFVKIMTDKGMIVRKLIKQ